MPKHDQQEQQAPSTQSLSMPVPVPVPVASSACESYLSNELIPRLAKQILSGTKATVDGSAVAAAAAADGVPLHRLGAVAEAARRLGRDSDEDEDEDAQEGKASENAATNAVSPKVSPGAQWAVDLIETEIVARAAAAMLTRLLGSSPAIRECPTPAVASFFNCLLSGTRSAANTQEAPRSEGCGDVDPTTSRW